MKNGDLDRSTLMSELLVFLGRKNDHLDYLVNGGHLLFSQKHKFEVSFSSFLLINHYSSIITIYWIVANHAQARFPARERIWPTENFTCDSSYDRFWKSIKSSLLGNAFIKDWCHNDQYEWKWEYGADLLKISSVGYHLMGTRKFGLNWR